MYNPSRQCLSQHSQRVGIKRGQNRKPMKERAKVYCRGQRIENGVYTLSVSLLFYADPPISESDDRARECACACGAFESKRRKIKCRPSIFLPFPALRCPLLRRKSGRSLLVVSTVSETREVHYRFAQQRHTFWNVRCKSAETFNASSRASS